MAQGPRLVVNTIASASTFARMQLYKQVYTGLDAIDYDVVLVSPSDATTDTLYLVKVNKASLAGYTFISAVTGLTKYLRYTFCTHLGRVYYTNGTDIVGWISVSEASVVTVGTMTNAPLGTILISAKNTLWVGGTTVLSYTTGTALFTISSKVVTGTGTKWTTNVRAGDFIGTGSSPSTWYIVASVESDTSLTLTVVFAEATTSNTSYKNRRTTNRIVYWGAEECTNDFITAGKYQGFDSGSLIVNRKNTGLHNFDDSVLVFTDQKGFYIEGINPNDWRIPKATKLPVGCVSHESIISKDGLLGFASEKGFYITSGGQLTFSDLGAEPYSELISTKWANIDPEVSSLIHTFIYKDTLLIAVPDTTVYSETDSQLSFSTGTVSCSDTATTVTASGTSWRGKIMVNDQIRFNSEVDGNGDALYYTITAIATGASGDLTIDRGKSGAVSTVAYKIRKRRCNRIFALDTRTNLGKKWSMGWSQLDSVHPDGFSLFNNVLLYASTTSGSLYKYNTGGQMYAAAFTASAKTGRMDAGYPEERKLFKRFSIEAKGAGTVYITPYIDGVALTAVQHTFADSSNYTKVWFPSPDPTTGVARGFAGRGYEIEFLIECRGSNETIEINFPQFEAEILPKQ